MAPRIELEPMGVHVQQSSAMAVAIQKYGVFIQGVAKVGLFIIVFFSM